jgi:hypothetical protein
LAFAVLMVLWKNLAAAAVGRSSRTGVVPNPEAANASENSPFGS